MNFPKRDPGADLAFGVLSDLHMTHRGEGLQKLHQYLDLYSKVEPGIDAHVFAGDIVYQIDVSGGGNCDRVYTEPYEYLRLALDRHAKDLPLVYALGNHEYPQNCTDDALTAKAHKAALDAGFETRGHQVIKGYHFVHISNKNYQNQFTEEDEAWAMTEVRRALRQSGDLPVFVVFHLPIPGMVCHCNAPGHSEKFTKFLLSSRRIITICGHCHTSMVDPDTIAQKAGGGTVIHAPMGAVGNIGLGKSRAGYHVGVFHSYSLFFEVKGTQVLIHKIDNLCEREIGKPWIVDVAGEQYYTKRRATIAKKPAFPEGIKAEADFLRGMVFFRFPKAYCEETPGNDDREVPYYRFEFFKKGEKTPADTFIWHSDYAGSNQRPLFDTPIPVDLPGGAYRVRITPISFFNKEGKPISAKVVIPENPDKAPKIELPYKVYSLV